MTFSCNICDLECEQQDASNVLNFLKESTFRMGNKISEELARERAIIFYLSLHATFHLSSDETFLTDPPAVLNTNFMDIYISSEMHNTLSSTCENLYLPLKTFSNVDLDGY